ncbi:MAG TPA: ABC transporter substrate-binding protein, partial [Chroococcidiopsis sp.]
IDVSSPSFNATKSVNEARQQGAHVLIVASNTATLDQALAVNAANQTQLPLLGGDSLYNPKLLEVGGENAKGMVVAVPWVLLSDPNSSFARSSRQLWGGDVNWRTVMSYDATQALAQGLQRAGSTSRDALVAAMHSSGFSVEGATGAVRFLPSGDRNQAMQLVVVSPGQRSGYGYDFVPAP